MSKPDEKARQFSIELARTAMRLKITPYMGMVCFGHMGGLMIAHEAQRMGVSTDELRAQLMDSFAVALDAGIRDGMKNPPPSGRPH